MGVPLRWHFRFLQGVGLMALAAILAAQQPTPGPPANSGDGGFGPPPTILPGARTGFRDTPIPGSEIMRHNLFTAFPGTMPRQREKLTMYFAAQYQRQNAADTNRLLMLARELSADSNLSGSQPTEAGMKKVQEIEKLARRVKQRLALP